MKTAVSIPTPIFQEAEGFARRFGKSRSQLYAQALEEYLSRHSPDEITDAMNRVVERIGRAPDKFLARAAANVLEKESW